MAATLLGAIGAARIGGFPISGFRPATVIPSVESRGIPFIVGNDRYQIVCCADTGTASSAPEFRYWYAGVPAWGEVLAGDVRVPVFYAADEDGDPVLGSLESSYKELDPNINELVGSVLVEFTPHPTAVEPGLGDETVGFTVKVEGFGLPDYAKYDGGMASGTVVSNSYTFAESSGTQASDLWPNLRTVRCPVRLNIRVTHARVIFTDISLCEINEFHLIGQQGPGRTN